MYAAVSRSPVVPVVSKQQRLGIHLEPVASRSSMRLAFVQGNSSCASLSPSLSLSWWPAEDATLEQIKTSSTFTHFSYSSADLCGPPANVVIQSLYRDPGCFRSILMTELRSSTTYNYKFSDDPQTYRFRSPPGVQSPVRAYYFADHAYNNDPPIRSFKTAERIAESDLADLVVTGGDLAYGMGFGSFWEVWQGIISRFAQSIPYVVAVGNHELDYKGGYSPVWGDFADDSGGECGVPTFARFQLGSQKKPYYFLDYGVMRWVIISTETDIRPGSTQHQWLRDTLAGTDRGATPWVAVVGHRPMYTSYSPTFAKQAHNVTVHLRRFLEPLFDEFDVTLGLWGHFHHYERMAPPGHRTVHLVVGTGGADLDSGVQWEPYSVSHIEDWGILQIDASERALKGSFSLNRDGSVFDEFVVELH